MYVCVVFKCLCLYVCVRVHIAYLEVVQWCLPMPDSLVTARWLENLRFKTLHVVKKLEETVGSHHNFVPLEALPIPMLSEYHRIISDSQLYDVIPLNNGFCNHLANIHPLPTTSEMAPFWSYFSNVTNQGSLERPVASSQGCGLQCRWNFGCCQKWIARNLYLGNCGMSTLMVQTSGDPFVGCFCKLVVVNKLSVHVVWWMMDNWTWKCERDWVSSLFWVTWVSPSSRKKKRSIPEPEASCIVACILGDAGFQHSKGRAQLS